MAGGAVFKLGSFGNFSVFNQRDAGPNCSEARMNRFKCRVPSFRGCRRAGNQAVFDQ